MWVETSWRSSFLFCEHFLCHGVEVKIGNFAFAIVTSDSVHTRHRYISEDEIDDHSVVHFLHNCAHPLDGFSVVLMLLLFFDIARIDTSSGDTSIFSSSSNTPLLALVSRDRPRPAHVALNCVSSIVEISRIT